jgi:hypothetical protein
MTSIPQLLPSPGAGIGLGVTLDDLAFNQGNVDENGVEHYLSALEGWDSPSLREDLDDRPLAHGADRGTSYYGVREIGLKGSLVSPLGIEALRIAKDRLAYACDLTDTDGVLTVAENPVKQALVRRSGRLRYAQVGGHLLRWELDVTAADPRKYAAVPRSVTLSPGQTAPAVNVGTFRSGAPLVAVFAGAGTLLVGGQPIRTTGPVTVDTLDGTALAGGITAYSRLGAGSTFPHLPAQATTPLTYSGNGSVTVTWRDAWV